MIKIHFISFRFVWNWSYVFDLYGIDFIETDLWDSILSEGGCPKERVILKDEDIDVVIPSEVVLPILTLRVVDPFLEISQRHRNPKLFWEVFPVGSLIFIKSQQMKIFLRHRVLIHIIWLSRSSIHFYFMFFSGYIIVQYNMNWIFMCLYINLYNIYKLYKK